MEVWKDVVGYENKYKVSNTGHIKSMNYNNTGEEKILKPKINKQGHLEVTLSLHNKSKDFILSRLIIETFLGVKLTRNDIVMYKDNDKTNTALDNLYVISRGKRQEITYDQDARERLMFQYYDEVLPIKEISKRNGISVENIRRRLKLSWNIYEEGEIPKAIIRRIKK